MLCVGFSPARNKKAPLCRVGRSNEPAKAGGAAVIGCASGFLETEACTTRNLAALLGVALAQTSLRQPSRAKQEPSESYWPVLRLVKEGNELYEAGTCASASWTMRSRRMARSFRSPVADVCCCCC